MDPLSYKPQKPRSQFSDEEIKATPVFSAIKSRIGSMKGKKTMLNFDQVKILLERAYRDALEDHAFGDSEVDWFDLPPSEENRKHLACGYFGRSANSIGASDGSWEFSGEDAKKLQYCGKRGLVERNDAGGRY